MKKRTIYITLLAVVLITSSYFLFFSDNPIIPPPPGDYEGLMNVSITVLTSENNPLIGLNIAIINNSIAHAATTNSQGVARYDHGDSIYAQREYEVRAPGPNGETIGIFKGDKPEVSYTFYYTPPD